MDGNSNVTAVFLLYPENLIEWTTGDSDGGVGGLGGTPAEVGLVSEDPLESIFIFSNTSDVVDIESTTNVEIAGLWIFRVDQLFVISPGLIAIVVIVCCIKLVPVVVVVVV